MGKNAHSISRFIRLIHPMPAFLITCAGEDAQPNAIAIAWLTPVSVDPPLLAFAIHPRRYSYQLLKENLAFVVNVMAYDQAPEVLFCGRCSGRDVDKFAEADLTAVSARSVDAPAIAEALAHVECDVEAKHVVGDHVMIVGHVRAVSAEQGVLADGWRDLSGAQPLFHAGGDRFTTSTGETVEPEVGSIEA